MLVSQNGHLERANSRVPLGVQPLLLRARHFRQTYKNIVAFNQIVPDRV